MISLLVLSCNNRREQTEMERSMAEFEEMMEEINWEQELGQEEASAEDYDDSESLPTLSKNSKSSFELSIDSDIPVEFETSNCTIEATKKGYLLTTTDADTCSVSVFYDEIGYYGDSERILYEKYIYLLK